jgi:sulfopyruvate decarboxylase subunit alpha
VTQIIGLLRQAGIDLVATLPDSWLTPWLDAIEAEPGVKLVRVTREDEAVAICAGAWLGGRRAAVLAQSGGFLLSVNALAGYALHHHIPILLLLAQRGGTDDDQYYQIYKGKVTVPVLEALRLPYHVAKTSDDVALIPDAYRQATLSRGPVAVLLSKDALKA